MKNTITITIEPEKLSALNMYMEQKNTSVEDELMKFTEQLFKKNVPQNVRDFIDMMVKQQDFTKLKKSAKDNAKNSTFSSE